MIKRLNISSSFLFVTFVIILGLFSRSCSKDYLLDFRSDNVPGAGTWLINETFIRWGCPGKDCIPSINNPKMVKADSDELSYLENSDLVVGVKKGEDCYAFPHKILDWHEVVNMDGYSVSYCPLTGSAIHIVDDRGFGVSGLLFNSNLIMYDKTSDSYWPQMLLKSAAGKFRGEGLILNRSIETTWGTWRKLFPETYAVSSQTGYSRNYNVYPYGDYKNSSAIAYPLENSDDRLPAKERVIGFLNSEMAKAYPVANFDTISVVHDTVREERIVLFASSVDNLAALYKTNRKFSVKEYDVENGVVLFTDDETGSEWNILGEAVSGELKGEVLMYLNSYISYWFSWAAFYPQTDLWEKE